MDGICLYHIFGWRGLFKSPRSNFYYVAAKETMHDRGLLYKIFSYTGAISIERSWREMGKEVMRNFDLSGYSDIKKALSCGRVLTFPQGTLKKGAPGRIGVAKLIKEVQPTVLPIVLSGIDDVFDTKSARLKATGKTIKIKIKQPLKIDKDLEDASVLELVMDAIEQS